MERAMSNCGLNVFTSNRLEILVEQLSREIRKPLAAPLDQDLIIVQSQGMARWISMELARINRICANTVFPFPNAFLRHLSQKLLPDVREGAIFDSAPMTFRIMAVLPERLQRAEYRDLRAYLADDPQGIKLFQLSNKIADLFDQYLVFRPDMIRIWDQNAAPTVSDQLWQADLWKAIMTPGEADHRAYLQERLLETLLIGDAEIAVLPKRVSAFGISHLPRFHIEIMAAVSKHVPVNLFLMNPCREYWGEIVTRRDIRRIREHYTSKSIGSGDLHLDKGNRILSTMGALGRDFLSMISELECVQVEMFKRPRGQTMLSKIQADLLDLLEPAVPYPTGTENWDGSVSDVEDMKSETIQDSSIVIHACHSPMREIEILHDHILAMLSEDSSLMPRDILVMIPDIETYTPFITAVFGAVADERMRIPFSIADRSVMTASSVIEGFLAILELTESRMEVGRILDLLAYPAIREKFGIMESALPRIEGWIRDVNIRWGEDARARSQLGLPAGDENTWKAGIQRMLLGIAMPGNNQDLFSGILPYDNMEGEDTLLLGKFLDFLENLFKICSRLEQSQSMSQWVDTFISTLDRMFSASDASERDLRTLQQAIEQMLAHANVAEFKNRIDMAVVKACLCIGLERDNVSSGFILGGVTFCAMLPMRSIPFEVICLLGMNADAFPRDNSSVGFDLMASHPRKGDRSRREDDKYLFLEALISARKKLYVSYIGQSVQDNSQWVPSVLVSELIDYIQDRFGIDPHDLVAQHPLQAFSRDYFSESSPFFSFSMENFEAATRQHARESQARLISDRLEPPSDDWLHVDIESLCRFFKNPTRFLLQRRLGIILEEVEPLRDDQENFKLERLEKYLLEAELCRFYGRGDNFNDLKPAVDARGILPHGEIGRYAFRRMCREIKQYVDYLATYTRERKPAVQPVEHRVNRFFLTGNIPGIYDNDCLHARYAGSSPGDMIRTWLYHLIRSCVSDELSGKSWYVARDAAYELLPVNKSPGILQSLMTVYWEGLTRPIHFFPVASHAYAKQVLQHSVNREKALRAVENKWDNDYVWSEADDPYISFCFREANPLDKHFENLALSVFGPLLSHARRVNHE